MKPRHQVSRAGVVLIKRFEGLRAKAAQLEDGRFTLGYGHTKTARGGAMITEADAEALLLYDLIEVAHAVNEWTFAPLNQNQFDALVSFAFNIGLENFQRSTTLRRLNEGRPLEAALAMELWRRADVDGERIVVDALVRRRAFEKALFLKPVDFWPPAPSPVLPPKLDYDTGALTPSSPPLEVLARLDGDHAIASRTNPQRLMSPEERSPPEDLDEQPSPSEAAAAAVTARLEAILADSGASPPGPEDIPDLLAGPIEPAKGSASPAHTQDAALEPIFSQEGGGPSTPAPAVVVQEEVAQEGELELARSIPAAFDRRIAPSGKAAATRDRVNPLLFLGLLFVGGVLFYSAVRWGFSASGSGAGSENLVALGWLAGALGIACCAAAAYFLLSRLSDRD